MGAHRARRTAAWLAALLPLALVVPAAAAPGPATADRALTTGRFLTVGKHGIELVDEDGGHAHLLVRARGRVQLAAVHPNTQTFLWSESSHGQRTWHVSSFYGTVLGSFTVPRHAGVPTTDPEGFVAYWVRPGRPGRHAALAQRPVDVPSSRPSVLRDLGPGGAGTVTVSPDDHWVAVDLAGAVHLVGLDGRADMVPVPPAGFVLESDQVVWSPDSTRLAAVMGDATQDGLYSLPVVAGGPATRIGPRLDRLLDWSPDGQTVLGQRGRPRPVGVDVATGAVHSYPVRLRGPQGLFWSGLRPRAVPRDRVAPRLAVELPRCVDLTARQCHRLRGQAYAWQQAIGTASDAGGSGLRYVVVAAFERRGAAWWALVGNGRHPTWRRFATRNLARYGATERTATLDSTGLWTVTLPGVTAGTLGLVAKAADGAANVRVSTRTVTLR